MNSFSDYMNTVKAEDALKESTKVFVRKALTDTQHQSEKAESGLEFRKEKVVAKKLLIAISSIAACAILAFGGYAFYQNPVNYVCVDINPSVELGVNAFDSVVSTQAYNEDGLKLLEKNHLSKLSVDEAIGVLIGEASTLGFIAEDGSTVIAVTAESNRAQKADKLLEIGEAGVRSALSAEDISAILYSDSTDLQLREQAMEVGVSPGKLKLIQTLQVLDPSISISQYKEAKLTDIIIKANNLMSQSDNGEAQIEGFSRMREKIQIAAQQAGAIYTNAQQEQNVSGEQNAEQGSGVGEQNQPQSQGSNGDVTQNQSDQSQNQNSGAQPQQIQNQGGTEQIQNQEQGSSSSVSEQNQAQTTDTQSGTSGTTEDNGSGSQSPSDTEGTGAGSNVIGNQTTSSPTKTGTETNADGTGSSAQSGSEKGGG